MATDYSALRRKDWSRRHTASEFRKEQVRQSLEDMSADLDAARKALTDLALGSLCVKVQVRPGQYEQPTREQARHLASDPTLLPALLDQGLARIYAIPPDVAAIKLLMGYVMGGTPNATEVVLREELERSHENQALLAAVLREYVPAEYLAPVAARLERIAQGRPVEDE